MKRSAKVQQLYFGHEISYLFKPGSWMEDTELQDLRSAFEHVNRTSGKNFRYGIFDSGLSLEQFRILLSRMNLGVIRYAGEAVGCFYNFIVREKPTPILHAGLVMIAKNTGVDLLNAPYLTMATLQRQRFGDYLYTNISSTPAIVGGFGELVTGVWPSHKSRNLIRPPRKYREVVEQLYQEYIRAFFPEDEIEIDLRRFVMRSPSTEMGFDTTMRNLARHSNLKANLFCDFWLDYSRGEDLIQVGVVNYKVALKAYAYLSLQKSKEVGKRFASLLGMSSREGRGNSRKERRSGSGTRYIVQKASFSSLGMGARIPEIPQ
ncbi:MAG: hypothetical protein NDJ89_08485 [Oligoflexia bacterium]|nr:hypothetical protein [Oligoflexia bacterium]